MNECEWTRTEGSTRFGLELIKIKPFKENSQSKEILRRPKGGLLRMTGMNESEWTRLEGFLHNQVIQKPKIIHHGQ